MVVRCPQDEKCSRCRKSVPTGGIVRQEKSKKLCLKCAGLDHLEFLPSGDVAMTRRAAKHSMLSAPVMEFNRRSKRYERRGTLAEPAAISQARKECQADSGDRAQAREKAAVRREIEDAEYQKAFTERIRILYPGCPAKAAKTIALHACEKHSGRVGRTANAKKLEDRAVNLAVRAHIRHLHTNYDRLLEDGVLRKVAREQVLAKTNQVAAMWKKG